MLKILVADDHPIVRQGIKWLIDGTFNSALVDETNSGLDALNKIRTQPWDVVILDVNLPDKNGLELLQEAKALNGKLPVIMLSASTEERCRFRAMKAGADAYVTKQSAPSELINAIQAICTDRSMTVPTQVRTRASESTPAASSLLSNRELEILRMIAEGATPKEIAHTLGISYKTVSSYRARIMVKLHLRTTVDLIKYAVERGDIASTTPSDAALSGSR